MNGILAKKADVERIYLPYQEGGRGLMNLEKEYNATMVGLYQYMTYKEDTQISALLRHHRVKPYTQYPRKLQYTWLKQEHQKI